MEHVDTPLFDTHSHALDLSAHVSLRTGTVALVSSEEADWPTVLALAAQPRVVAGLGVHPWKAHAVQAGWQARLEAALVANPRCIVAEVGLDRVATTPDTHRVEWAAQTAVLEAQLLLAARLRRPVSLHAVQCWGALRDLLEGLPALPPRIAVHSYGGTAGFARTLLALERGQVRTQFFFGFSATINLRSPKTPEVIAGVTFQPSSSSSSFGLSHVGPFLQRCPPTDSCWRATWPRRARWTLPWRPC